MSLDFPANPTIGDIYDAGTAKWRWTGAAWARVERVFPKVTLEDFGYVSGGTVDAALAAAVASGVTDVWATEGEVYELSSTVEATGVTNFCLHMDGATLKLQSGCEAALRLYDYENAGIDFGATGRFIGNYTEDGPWVSHLTVAGGGGTGTSHAAYTAGATATIVVDGLDGTWVQKGARVSYIVASTTYSYIVQDDAAITAGSATLVLDRVLDANITLGKTIYVKFWGRRMVVASDVSPTDTSITLQCYSVTSSAGTPRILAGDEFSFHTNYNDIDSVDYTKVCKVAPTGPIISYNMTGALPAMTVTVPLTAPVGRSIPRGTMITSIQDHRNNRYTAVLFYGGTGGFVRGGQFSDLRLHGVGQGVIHAPWNGVAPSTKPNIDFEFSGNVDASTDAVGSFCAMVWATRGLTIKGNRATYALGQVRNLAGVERSQGFLVEGNSCYGGQYLVTMNGECSDGSVVGNRGVHMMRTIRQANTSTRLTIAHNVGIGHASYTDWHVMVWSGMIDDDGASAGSALRINSTKVIDNEFFGPGRTSGGYGSHIIVGPQNMNPAADENDWPRQVWVFGNTSTDATVHGIYVLHGDSVTLETNFVVASGEAGIYVDGGMGSVLLNNEVLDCCADVPGDGIVLDGATNVKANGNKTTVDGGTGMTAGIALLNGATLRGEDNNDWNGTVTSGGLSLMAKQSRADLAALCEYGWRANDGQIVQAGDRFFIGSTGATDIPGMPGMKAFKFVSPRDFGAVGDGVHDDGPALEAWWEAIRATLATATETPIAGAVCGYLEDGVYYSATPLVLVADRYHFTVIGQSWNAALSNVSISMTKPWCKLVGFSMIGSASAPYGVRFAANMPLVERMNIRLFPIGVDMASGFGGNVLNSLIHRNDDGVIYRAACLGHSVTDSEILANDRGVTQEAGGEFKMSSTRVLSSTERGFAILGDSGSVPIESYFEHCTFTNSGSQEHTITSIASHSSGIEVTFDADHYLTRGMGGVELSGTGVGGYDGVSGYVVQVTASNAVVLNIPYVSTATGTATCPGWDILVQGTAPNYIRNIQFVGCNTNHVYLENCYNVSLNSPRAFKQRLWLADGVSQFSINRVGPTGEYGGSATTAAASSERTKELPICGPGSIVGWTEVAHTQSGKGGWGAGSEMVVLRAPAHGSTMGVNNEPSDLIEARVSATGFRVLGAVQIWGLVTGTAVQTSSSDTTAGRLLTVGAFGLGGAATLLTSADNLNNITAGGYYYWTSSSVPANAPGSFYSLMEHIQGVSRSIQKVTRIGSSTSNGLNYNRSNSLGTWEAWNVQYSRNNIYQAVGQSGGIPTGGVLYGNASTSSPAGGHSQRLASGFQTCQIVATSSASADTAITFTDAFLSGSTPVASIMPHGDAEYKPRLVSISNTALVFSVRDSGGNRVSVPTHIHVAGLWSNMT